MSPFLVTGTGRCRTAWAASVLRARGVRCGHQDVVTNRQVLGEPIEWGDWEGDASFQAAPIARTLGVRVVAITRHPCQVAASWCSLGAFTDRMHETHIEWSEVLDLVAPEVLAAPTQASRAGLFWLAWTQFALDAADEVLAFETLTAEDLFAAVGRPGAVDDIGPVDWGTPQRVPVTIDLGSVWDLAAPLARQLGYEAP